MQLSFCLLSRSACYIFSFQISLGKILTTSLAKNPSALYSPFSLKPIVFGYVFILNTEINQNITNSCRNRAENPSGQSSRTSLPSGSRKCVVVPGKCLRTSPEIPHKNQTNGREGKCCFKLCARADSSGISHFFVLV